MSARLAIVFLLISATAVTAQELRRSGFLGLKIDTVPEGVKVQAVVEGGTGKASGIQPGDVITQMNGAPAGTAEQFVNAARSLRAGDVATVQIKRGGETLTAKLRVVPRPMEPSSDVDVLYRAVDAGGQLRRVIVTVPRAAGKHPAVLYVTGIGCFSQESLDRTAPDAQLLYGLTRAGFVTMRVEKSGINDSEGPPCSSLAADFHAEVNGYLAGLRALKQYPFVDPGNTFLFGLSIGGVEAPLIAKQERVRGIVAVNTVSKPFFEYLLDTRRRQMELGHMPYDDVDRQMRAEEICNHRFLIDKQDASTITKDLPDCKDRIAYPAPASFMQQWADVNIAAAWKAIDVPVLVVFGSSDFVATTADQPHLVALINSFHPGRATLREVEGMDHFMTRARSMEESMSRKGAGEFVPEMIDILEQWLQSQVATR